MKIIFIILVLILKLLLCSSLENLKVNKLRSGLTSNIHKKGGNHTNRNFTKKEPLPPYEPSEENVEHLKKIKKENEKRENEMWEKRRNLTRKDSEVNISFSDSE